MVNQRVATSMLKRYGAIVSSVNSGIEDKKLDLVLMDIQMSEVILCSLELNSLS